MNDTHGYFKAVVRTADGIIPIEGARVTVEGDGQVYELLTDRSGITPVLTLAAPPAENSQSALQAAPFTSYRITTKKEGFYTQITENAPVFEGVVSVQPVLLIGLSEFGSDVLVPLSDTDTVQTDPQALRTSNTTP